MLNLSTLDLLGLWSDLCDAYHGRNGFGGDTAEIYAYRCGRPSPASSSTGPLGRQVKREDAERAAASLVAVCQLFEREHSCEVLLDTGAPRTGPDDPSSWRRAGPWFDAFDHRVQVRVRKEAASRALADAPAVEDLGSGRIRVRWADGRTEIYERSVRPEKIPATHAHDRGAYARCSYCGRYTADPRALSSAAPWRHRCDCGRDGGWSGSFVPPGPYAVWSSGGQEDGNSPKNLESSSSAHRADENGGPER